MPPIHGAAKGYCIPVAAEPWPAAVPLRAAAPVLDARPTEVLPVDCGAVVCGTADRELPPVAVSEADLLVGLALIEELWPVELERLPI